MTPDGWRTAPKYRWRDSVLEALGLASRPGDVDMSAAEVTVLTEVEELVRASGGCLVEDDRFVVVEVIAPGIELGYRMEKPLCGSKHDLEAPTWRNDAGRPMCGICHPPVARAASGQGGS